MDDNMKHRRGVRANIASSKVDSKVIPVSSEEVQDIVSKEFDKLWLKLENTISDIISAQLKPLKEEIANFKKSVSFINSEFENINKKVEHIEKDVKSLISTKAIIGELKDITDKIQSDNNDREQWGRRSNIEIYGVPEKKGENLFNIFKDISHKANCPVNISTDLDFITRVASKNSSKKCKPIVVRFLARYKKDDFLSNVRKLKLKACDLGYSNVNTPIFFNDHLTSSNKILLQRAKNRAKDNHYRYIWVKNCSIMVRRNDTSPIVHISSEKDLNKIK
ncbi:uncharacterized protein LOC124531733 [Vanessa cardui]|uniref:uncharacterized protein LOC124531733 n=1 Tax=Vanessa cardui TaxID=171605 RepID=UPI001F12D2DD|nr:uncharacterized protein LOC124531733 [Vanessa cardui]